MPPQYDGKPLRRHAKTLGNTHLLHSFRCAHENHGIDLAVKTCLEQKGDVENNQPRTLFRRIRQEGMAAFRNQRMHNGFEPRERRRIAEHPRAKQSTIDNALAHGAWKRRLDQGSRRTFVESMDDSIRVMDRICLLPEHRGGCRFAHADRAGEARAASGRRPDIGLGQGAQFRCYRRSRAEPAREPRHGLMQKHADAGNGPKTPRPSSFKERRFERNIDDVADDRAGRERGEIDGKRRLPAHPEGRRVDEQRGAFHRTWEIPKIRNLNAKLLCEFSRPRARPVGHKNTLHLAELEGVNNGPRGASRAEDQRRTGIGVPLWCILIQGAEKPGGRRCCHPRVFPLRSTGHRQLQARGGLRQSVARCECHLLVRQGDIAANKAVLRETRTSPENQPA